MQGSPPGPHPTATSSLDRVLGSLGIVGGLVLLAAFLPASIPNDLNTVRLVLFNLGAIAVAIGVARGVAIASPSIGVAAAAVVLANTWHLVMVVVSTTVERPFAGDYGLVFFWAGVAMWLADAWLGFALVRDRHVRRMGPLVLAVGSLLAIVGMDRLGLISAGNPTFFGPLALIGIFLNGLGWILLGLELAMLEPQAPDGDAQGADVHTRPFGDSAHGP